MQACKRVIFSLLESPSTEGEGKITVDFNIEYLSETGEVIEFDKEVLSHRIINTMVNLFDDYNQFVDSQGKPLVEEEDASI